MVLLLVGPLGLLLGSQATHRHRPPHPAPRALELAAYPSGSTATSTATISPAAGSLTSSSATGAPSLAVSGPPAGQAPPRAGTVVLPPAASNPAPAAPAAPYSTTIASWYGGRPEACYDPSQRSPLPPGITVWAASRTLRCGTTIEVSGPAGTIRMQIEDHGPWMLPGRDLDLSPQAFTSVAGSLSVGLAAVRFRVVG
ncbi:MAG: hypothetical protein NVSMB32_00690 [Actinomycetota bacterium]